MTALEVKYLSINKEDIDKLEPTEYARFKTNFFNDLFGTYLSDPFYQNRIWPNVDAVRRAFPELSWDVYERLFVTRNVEAENVDVEKENDNNMSLL